MKLYKKIHIHVKTSAAGGWRYICSTNQAKTCKQAKANFLNAYPEYPLAFIKANFARD